MELSGKKILVVGLGKTGLALTKFLKRQGSLLMISDARGREELESILNAESAAAFPPLIEGGGHTSDFFLQADLILVSPGIPLDLPPLWAAREKGIPIQGELELFSRYCRTPIIAVTGTNGKTTTTALINEMLLEAGFSTFLGGNIGRPLVEYLLNGQDKDLVVAEISSFQLDTTRHFCPRVGLLLNITEDHLDRYPDFQGYIQSKTGLFRNQGEQDTAVLNWDDPLVRGFGAALKGPVYDFSRSESLSRGAYLDLDRLRLNLTGAPESYDLQAFPLPGVHNRENALAAVLGARLLGAAPEAVQRALERFKGFRHRLEWVAEVRGIQFFDDSKGTNVGAVVKALEGFSRPVILIAGGRDKGGDYGPLKGLIREKVKALVLIGEAREKMRDQLGDLTRTEWADSLEAAVSRAFGQGIPGDVVLLSPGCSSFDMFRDYAQRGEVFQQAVRRLKNDYE
ncbi:MAG TPA: UDP-N-acetylmuramoyl-L-alanine--D-glutamate ligase [Thermodesulfobacteriota bacterium]|nr:UDP-N-acetylmuramoyl-L-alanine--D-glutamate ligase [Thermodesulfobacteriota bacterium]